MPEEQATGSEPAALPVPKKQRGGKPWVKGQSGNPKGRPMRTYATAERMRASLVDVLPGAIATLAKAATGGEASLAQVRAAEVIIKHSIAPLKPVESTVRLDLPFDSTLAQQGAALLQAAARGEIAPSQAAALMMGLGAQARVVEVDELKRRMEAIEAALKPRLAHGKVA